MKKTAIHFKIAAWSINNPKLTYMAIAGALLIFLAVGIGTTWLVVAKNSSAGMVAIKGGDGVGSFDLEGWSIRKQWATGDTQCIGYIRDSNNTRLTSCYKKVGNQWVFMQSY